MNFRNISLLSTRNIHCLILISLLLLAFMFSLKYMTGNEAYGATCANLPISAVKANGAQATNPASKAVDNDATTRWSNQGLGSWIRLNLGSKKTVCSVDISWYNGNQRQYTFTIKNYNNIIKFKRFFDLKSSRTTTALQRYDVTDSQGRYVKVTVTGNTQNDWMSIIEINVYGGNSASTADAGPPLVINTNPGHGDTGVPVAKSITATFNEPVLASSVSTSTFIVKNSADVNIPGLVSLSQDGTIRYI